MLRHGTCEKCVRPLRQVKGTHNTPERLYVDLVLRPSMPPIPIDGMPPTAVSEGALAKPDWGSNRAHTF